MKNLLLIYNPHSGKGRVPTHLAGIIETLTRAGWLVTTRPTLAPGEASALARDLASGFDRIVCCGGDGTLNEVVSGLSFLDAPPVLGYIPTGTTNDFSRNLALPKGMEAAAAVAAEGYPTLCDAGKFNDRSFLYIAAFGAFTDVAYDTPQQFKNLFGHLAYILEGAARLPNLTTYPLTVEHDGVVESGEFLYGMVGNTVSVGGFLSLPAQQVKLDDGLFEVLLIRKPQTPAELQELIRVLATQNLEEVHRCILGFHAAQVTITSAEPLPWTLDGEYGGAPLVAHIQNCPRVLQIVRGAP